jgi:hypothetical protein
MTRRRSLAAELDVRAQFARSVNVERDSGTEVVERYVPTARALDLLGRVVEAMWSPGANRAWSVVGPYGSGKSSFAVFLDSLLGPGQGPHRDISAAALRGVDEELAKRLEAVRSQHGATEKGFVRLSVTADREPVTATLSRGITVGLRRHLGKGARSKAAQRATAAVRELEAALRQGAGNRGVLEALGAITDLGPVLIVIDEFGKNIEYLADGAPDGDLFVLQEIAEASSGPNGLPIAILTMQHLSIEDYLGAASTVQRREWGKIQGRFEEVAFVDSPQQVRRLAATVFDSTRLRPTSRRDIAAWANRESEKAVALGLRGLADDAELVRASYPLHPTSLLVLPDLCSHYGQNERTLFSFLAGPEPGAVPAFMQTTEWSEPLASVRLDQLYDYFLENPSTITAGTANASRWFEVATRIRDVQSLGEDERRCLKVVGLINLVSQGGAVRASQSMLAWALVGSSGFRDEHEIRNCLERLCAHGVLTYRAFADEYRVWQGSDFDFAAALSRARHQLAASPPSTLLAQAIPLEPVVAARHSQQSGALRYFSRHFADSETADAVLARMSTDADGDVVYALDERARKVLTASTHSKPVIVASANNVDRLIELAAETAALLQIVESDEAVAEDWVARRELRERVAMAREALSAEFEATLGRSGHVTYTAAGNGETLDGSRGLSPLLSEICDAVYDATPIVRNEMLNRRELTSQGAKARRDLLEAMVDRRDKPRLGLEGYGPERAMYEAVLFAPGLHVERAAQWLFHAPRRGNDFLPVWRAMELSLTDARQAPLSLDELFGRLASAPFGVLDGPIPVLVTAWLLVHADDVAVYQDGTYQPRLTIELVERALKVPERFAIKHVVVGGARRRFLEQLAVSIEPRPLARDARNATLLQVVAPLVSLARELPEFTKRSTAQLSPCARAVRECLLSAREPDELIFRSLPEACELKPLAARRRSSSVDVGTYCSILNAALEELKSAYQRLLEGIADRLAERTRAPRDTVRTNLAARTSVLVGQALNPTVRSFLNTASDVGLDDDDWLEAIAMSVSDRPPSNWTDDDVSRFESALGGTIDAFRRLEALYYDTLETAGEGFEAARITRTEPDGTEQAEVYWVDAGQRATLRSIIAAAQTEAVSQLGPQAEDALLAVHAELVMKDAPAAPQASEEAEVEGHWHAQEL